MYKNLHTELAQKGIAQKELAKVLNISVMDLQVKLKRSLTFAEAVRVKEAIGTKLPLEKLFEVTE